MTAARQDRACERARATGVAILLGAYLVLEWLFAFASQAEGLVSPAGNPNLGLIAIGIAYLGLRFAVRLLLPIVASVLLAGLVWRRGSPRAT
jgi:hypothetical protein